MGFFFIFSAYILGQATIKVNNNCLTGFSAVILTSLQSISHAAIREFALLNVI